MPFTMLDTYRAQFDAFAAISAEKEPAWLRERRAAAMRLFEEGGFAVSKDEMWRFTPIKAVGEAAWTPGRRAAGVAAAAVEAAAVPGLGGHRLVFIDGHYAPEHSSVGTLPKGARLSNLASAIERGEVSAEHLGKYPSIAGHPFAQLNTALFRDGAFLSLANNVSIAEPIQLLFLSSTAGAASFVRNIFAGGDNANATVIEIHASIGDGPALSVPFTEVFSGANAEIDHYKLQRSAETATHFAFQNIRLGRDNRFRSHSFVLGDGLSRNDIFGWLDGPGIDTNINGLLLLGNEQHATVFMQIDHKADHCASHELFKSVLDGRSNGVFRGRIYVHEGAQKTDAKQTSKSLLLSGNATMNAKPQLEIYADDVKCTHGATIGQLERSHLFYLRSRGVPEAEARKMLVHAFAGEITDAVRVPELKLLVEGMIGERLG